MQSLARLSGRGNYSVSQLPLPHLITVTFHSFIGAQLYLILHFYVNDNWANTQQLSLVNKLADPESTAGGWVGKEGGSRTRAEMPDASRG